MKRVLPVRRFPKVTVREVTETGEFGGYFSLLFAWFTRAITVAITMQN